MWCRVRWLLFKLLYIALCKHYFSLFCSVKQLSQHDCDDIQNKGPENISGKNEDISLEILPLNLHLFQEFWSAKQVVFWKRLTIISLTMTSWCPLTLEPRGRVISVAMCRQMRVGSGCFGTALFTGRYSVWRQWVIENNVGDPGFLTNGRQIFPEPTVEVGRLSRWRIKNFHFSSTKAVFSLHMLSTDLYTYTPPFLI